MSDEANRSGQVSSTPEGGPIDAGAPSSEPGAGQVRATPEAVPAEDDVELVPPTWQEHMQGPIPGMDDAPTLGPGTDRPPASAGAAGSTPSTDWKGVPLTSVGTPSAGGNDEEPRTRPPYVGKPVSEQGWDALRYAAPVVSQAEKLAIKAIGLSGRGLSKLAQYLDARRQERENEKQRNAPGDR